MPTPPLPSRDDEPMTPPDVEPVVLWRWHPAYFIWRKNDPKASHAVEYRALPVAAYNALLARANTAKVAADLMRARAERAEEALEYVVSMWAKPHRGSCGTTLKDAEQCIAGLEMEIDAVVEHARAALSTQRGEG